MAKKGKGRARRARSAGGFGGGRPAAPGGGDLMSQVRKMQEELEKVQESLGDERITGTAGGGMVTVVVDGHQEILSIELKPEVVDPDDVEMLQDLLLAAIKDAVEKSKALAEEKMGGVTGGLGLPPGLGL